MTIRILAIKATNGPNIWSRTPVTVLQIDPGSVERQEIAALTADVRARILSLLAVETKYVPYEPVPVAVEGAIGALLGELALNLQRVAGVDVTFSHSRPMPGSRHTEVIVQHRHEEVGLAAARLAVRLLNHLISGSAPGFDLHQEFFVRFGTVAEWRRPGRAGAPIIAAAERRGVPVTFLDPSGKIIELGNGAYRRRFLGSITSLTPRIGDALSDDKFLTNLYLRSAGLPVPNGRVAKDPEQAAVFAREIGFPVVLKPVDSGGSAGLFVDLRDADEVRECFEKSAAVSRSSRVLVEPHLTGNQYRFLVVNDRVIAVELRLPAWIEGNGRQTIEELIASENENPRRSKRLTAPLKKIAVNDAMIQVLWRQGLNLHDVLPPGRRVSIAATANVHAGGMAIDMTDDLHPDNDAIVRQATRILELDIASIDVIAADITRSMWESGGAILDVNTGSGFIHHIHPAEGSGHDPGPAIVDMLFPRGRPVRAPLIAVTGQDATRLCARIGAIFAASGIAVGTATADGIALAGTRISPNDARTVAGVSILLNNPGTELVVAEVDPLAVMDEGLGFDYCDVAVVTSLSGLTTPFGHPVERVITGLCDASAALVLNADDPDVALLARSRTATAILFSLDSGSAAVLGQLSAGGRVVAARQTAGGEAISLVDGDAVNELMVFPAASNVTRVPGDRDRPIQLAAVAVAIARGIPLEVIRQVLAMPGPD